ncbi:M4 family metallopeptidase [Haloimpatiens sp. FM7330]|uniref:M4 family metallopeptidase n=1 Tax=Haloimpatiens sp. FM7330 TaxID=3298610 RepID=UPI0036394294
MNKKVISLVIASAMVFTTGLTTSVKALENRTKDNNTKGILFQDDDFIKDFFGEDFKIFWDDEEFPQFVRSELMKWKIEDFNDLEEFLDKNNDMFGLKKGDFSVQKVIKDKNGKKHYRTNYQINDIPVYGGEVIFHTDENGKMYAINGEIDKEFENIDWNGKIKIKASEAIKYAKEDIKPNKVFRPKAQLYLYKFEEKPYIVYVVELNCDKGNWKIFVNAENGQIVDKFNNTPVLMMDDSEVENKSNNKEEKKQKPEEAQKNKKEKSSEDDENKKVDKTKTENSENSEPTKDNNKIEAEAPKDNTTTMGTGKSNIYGNVQFPTYYENGKYYLYNTTKDMKGVIEIYDTNHKVNEKNIYNYGSKEAVKRESQLVGDKDNNFIDNNQTAAVDGYVNFSKVYDYYKNKLGRNSIDNKQMDIDGFVHVGNEFNNAFWYASYNAMFFGDGDGKDLSNISGALDVVAHELSHGVTSYCSNLDYRFQSGALNEAFSDIMASAVDNDDWLIGEDCTTPGIKGDALRDMSNPHNGAFSSQPADMSEYKDCTIYEDRGGVHVNCGIINHAAYYIGEELGRDAMAKIFYSANKNYWRYNSDFSEARDGVISAATEEYGKDSHAVDVVKDAFAKVGIKGNDGGSSSGEYKWNYEDMSIESPHNYPNNYQKSQKYSKEGAQRVAVHFSNISTENGYDYVYVLDKDRNVVKSFTGNVSDKWVVVEGDTLYVYIESDAYVNEYGYKVDRTAYYSN